MTDWNPNDPDATRVYYDLSRWTFDQQAADLVIAEVEMRLGIESDPTISELLESGEPPVAIALADGVPTTEYDLDEWPAADRQSLSHALTGASIPFAWDANVLLVGTTDESIVEQLLDDIERGEYIDVDGEADPAEQTSAEILTTFFLAGERLRRDPLDPDGLEQLLAATDEADPDVPPFGVQPRLWQQTCELADQLADALVEDDEPDLEAATTAAEALHDLLRPHI